MGTFSDYFRIVFDALPKASERNQQLENVAELLRFGFCRVFHGISLSTKAQSFRPSSAEIMLFKVSDVPCLSAALDGFAAPHCARTVLGRAEEDATVHSIEVLIRPNARWTQNNHAHSLIMEVLNIY